MVECTMIQDSSYSPQNQAFRILSRKIIPTLPPPLQTKPAQATEVAWAGGYQKPRLVVWCAFDRSSEARLSGLGHDVALDEDRDDRLCGRVGVDGHRLADATDTVGIIHDFDFAFATRSDGLAAPFWNCATAATFGACNDEVRCAFVGEFEHPRGVATLHQVTKVMCFFLKLDGRATSSRISRTSRCLSVQGRETQEESKSGKCVEYQLFHFLIVIDVSVLFFNYEVRG